MVQGFEMPKIEAKIGQHHLSEVGGDLSHLKINPRLGGKSKNQGGSSYFFENPGGHPRLCLGRKGNGWGNPFHWGGRLRQYGSVPFGPSTKVSCVNASKILVLKFNFSTFAMEIDAYPLTRLS